MNSEHPKDPREELELQITALLLGELDTTDAERIRKAIEENPDLQQFHDQLEQTLGLVKEASSHLDDEATLLRLSEKKREALLARFKTITPSAAWKPARPASSIRLVELAAILLLVGLLAAMLLPSLAKSKSKAQRITVLNNVKQLELAKHMWAEDQNAAPETIPTKEDLAPYLGSWPESVAGEKYEIGPASRPVAVQLGERPASGVVRGMERVQLADGRDAYQMQSGSFEWYAGKADNGRGETGGKDPNWIAAMDSPTPPTENGRNRFITRYDYEMNGSIDSDRGNKVNIALPSKSPDQNMGGARVGSGGSMAVGNTSFGGDENWARIGREFRGVVDESGAPVGQEGTEDLYVTSGLDVSDSLRAAQPPLNQSAQAGFQNLIYAGSALALTETQPDGLRLPRQYAGGYAAGGIALPQQQEQKNSDTWGMQLENRDVISDSSSEFVNDRTFDGASVSAGRLPQDMPVLGDLVTTTSRRAPGTEASSPTVFYNSATLRKTPGLSADKEAGVAATEEHAQIELGYSPMAITPLPNSQSNLRGGRGAGGSQPESSKELPMPLAPTGERFALSRDRLSTSGTIPQEAAETKDSDYDSLARRTDEVRARLGQLNESESLGLKYQNNIQETGEGLKHPLLSEDTSSESRRSITLNHATPENIAKVIESVAPNSQVEITSDGKLNVEGTQNDLAMAESLVSKLDTPTRQVLIEARLMETADKKKPSITYDAPEVTATEATAIDHESRNAVARNNSGGVHSVDVVGYVNMPTQPGNSVVDPQIPVSPTPSAPVQTDDYIQTKRELNTLLRMRDVIDSRTVQEKMNVALPKSASVAFVDKAVPETTTNTSLLRKLGRALGNQSQAVARIKVDPVDRDISELGSITAYDPYFVQTETEVINSEPVLSKAVEKMRAKVASPESANLTTEELRHRITLKPMANTSLVEIRAKSSDPNEAADMANAVGEAYHDYLEEQGRALDTAGIAALADQRRILTQKINAKQAELDALAQSNFDVGESGQTLPRVTPATALTPQPEVQTAANPFSTFSLNVSDVSFKLAGASLEQGQLPDPASIRSEEFLNAFNYRDPAPAPGQPLAFAWERARYPFAHNRDLLRFSVQTGARGREAGRPLNLVLLLDNSGSMERADRVRIIRECLNVLAGQLTPQDKISVVTFARTARLWVDGVPGVQAAASLATAGQLTPEGGTNLEEAMSLAYATAHRHYLADGVNRVVLLTDGAANLGNVDPDSLKSRVEAERKQGIALDCFGIGWEGYNDDLLEVLSRNGDGRYGFVNTPQDAANEFAAELAGALQVAASDVKVQVEFNPARVTAYRQIGYAKHQLTKEQFRDNTVDAAEIGAAESGNALYVVETNPQGQGPIATVRARFKVPGTGEYKEYEWRVPYTGESIALENASEAMRLTAAASAFSERLAASPYAGEVTTDRLLNILSGVPEVFGVDPRPKKLEWMIREAGRLAGN